MTTMTSEKICCRNEKRREKQKNDIKPYEKKSYEKEQHADAIFLYENRLFMPV
jgi:hypothetical protein